MNFFSGFIKGIFIGFGAILPGISSGVLCVIFGIYDKLVEHVLGIFKHFKESFFYLLPITLGGIVGIVLFGNILNALLARYPIPMKYLFIGLILGSVPMLIKKINSNRAFHLNYFLYTLISFIVGIILVLLESYLSTHITSNTMISLLIGDSFISLQAFCFLIIAGFFMSIGIVVPGVSSTVILMCFGIYELYLSAISTLNLTILFPLGIGLIIGGFLFLKIINFLIKHFYMQTFYAIVGFSLGSILVLYEPISFNITGFISILILIIGFYLANFFESKA